MTNVIEKNIYDDDVGTYGEFNREYVRQVSAAAFDLFSEMKKASGARDHKGLYDGETLNKNSITKAKLSEWLGTLVCLMDHYTIPLLESAVQQKDGLEALKEEKIVDQKKIIELQGKLIEKREEELKSVQSTVKSELKSVKSTVESELKKLFFCLTEEMFRSSDSTQNSCSSALS